MVWVQTAHISIATRLTLLKLQFLIGGDACTYRRLLSKIFRHHSASCNKFIKLASNCEGNSNEVG